MTARKPKLPKPGEPWNLNLADFGNDEQAYAAALAKHQGAELDDDQGEGE